MMKIHNMYYCHISEQNVWLSTDKDTSFPYHNNYTLLEYNTVNELVKENYM